MPDTWLSGMPAGDMSAAEARRILDRLRLSQVRFAEMIGVNDRTVRRWLSPEESQEYPVPLAVSLLLKAWKSNPSLVPYTPEERAAMWRRPQE